MEDSVRTLGAGKRSRFVSDDIFRQLLGQTFRRTFEERSLLRRNSLWSVTFIAIATLAMLAISQTTAFLPDEGFHLNAAHLINQGKVPYRDFLYGQPPLYAYMNAVWMQVFGETWRSSHALSALLSSGCAALLISYLFSRYSGAQAITAGAIGAVFFTANTRVMLAGGVSQAYGACLLLSMASFRLAVRRTKRSTLHMLASGLCAGAAAQSSMLTAPLVAVLLFWILFGGESDQQFKRSLYYLAGVAIASVPLVLLAINSPRQALFNVFEYHMFHRQLEFDNVAKMNAQQVISWLDSSQGTLLLVLSLFGLLASRRVEPGIGGKSELTLCTWMGGSLFLYLSIVVRPTFSQYFVLVAPFAAILGGIGAVYFARLFRRQSKRILVLVLGIVLYCLPAALPAYQVLRPRMHSWPQIEAVGKEINRTAPEGLLYTPLDYIYFQSKRPALPGLGVWWAEGIQVNSHLAQQIHAVPKSEIDRWLLQRRFAAVVLYDNDERIERLGLTQLYHNRKLLDGDKTLIFW